MDGPPPSYRSEFLRSPHHGVLALATVGVGFLTGSWFPLFVGAGLYALGWIYLPDSRFFRGWVDRRREAVARAAAEAEFRAFQERRERIIASLSAKNRERYATMIDVCRDIESANADVGDAGDGAAQDPRLRKLDELAWTYLRLLAFQQSLEEFLETERREDLPAALKVAESEAEDLRKEIEGARTRKEPIAESRVRLFESARDTAEVLLKRMRRLDQAKENLRLASSEQERLVQQVKLVRADSVASKNARNFSARIDATVEHLEGTNRWLTEIEDFKDLVGDMPRSEARVGLGNPTAPASRGARRAREKGEEV